MKIIFTMSQAWAASLPTALLRLPYSFVESMVLSCIIYWVSGLAPEAGRCTFAL